MVKGEAGIETELRLFNVYMFGGVRELKASVLGQVLECVRSKRVKLAFGSVDVSNGTSITLSVSVDCNNVRASFP